MGFRIRKVSASVVELGIPRSATAQPALRMVWSVKAQGSQYSVDPQQDRCGSPLTWRLSQALVKRVSVLHRRAESLDPSSDIWTVHRGDDQRKKRSVISELHIFSAWTFWALANGVSHCLSFVEIVVSNSLACRTVKEHIFTIVLCGNESKAFVGETLDRSLFHLS